MLILSTQSDFALAHEVTHLFDRRRVSNLQDYVPKRIHATEIDPAPRSSRPISNPPIFNPQISVFTHSLPAIRNPKKPIPKTFRPKDREGPLWQVCIKDATQFTPVFTVSGSLQHAQSEAHRYVRFQFSEAPAPFRIYPIE